ncbi:MAG: hypothetical protein ACR2Q4_14195, partial [Geminicoccaceae bacterium]
MALLIFAAIGSQPADGLAADAKVGPNAAEPHWDLLSEEAYPRAAQCGVCHQQIYREWSASNHA